MSGAVYWFIGVTLGALVLLAAGLVAVVVLGFAWYKRSALLEVDADGEPPKAASRRRA